MIVVSDTTALSTLFLIEKLSWLKELFGSIIIPQAVLDELSELANFGHNIEVFQIADWIVVEKVSDQKMLSELAMELDIGEREAIVLALEKKADILLIDERKGARIATELGVRSIGLLRLLIELKQRSIIPQVEPILIELRESGGFWMSEKLYRRVLEEAGE